MLAAFLFAATSSNLTVKSICFFFFSYLPLGLRVGGSVISAVGSPAGGRGAAQGGIEGDADGPLSLGDWQEDTTFSSKV